MEELKDSKENKECCNKNNTQNLVLVSVLVLLLSIGLTQGIQAYQQKDVSWQCVEFSGLGQTYWDNECRYGFRKQNMTCESSLDEGKTDDFVWTISKNGTFVNETRMPCTKYIYVKRPSGAASANISMG